MSKVNWIRSAQVLLIACQATNGWLATVHRSAIIAILSAGIFGALQFLVLEMGIQSPPPPPKSR